MASAVVCDRCGKTVKYRGDAEAEAISLARHTHAGYYSTESGPKWDFCAECWESFLSFAEPSDG